VVYSDATFPLLILLEYIAFSEKYKAIIINVIIIGINLTINPIIFLGLKSEDVLLKYNIVNRMEKMEPAPAIPIPISEAVAVCWFMKLNNTFANVPIIENKKGILITYCKFFSSEKYTLSDILYY
jgi:hypothetical protein